MSHGSYVLKTALGVLRIALEEVECLVDACPKLDGTDLYFSIADLTNKQRRVVPTLLSGYAEDVGADYQVGKLTEEAQQISIVDRAQGQSIANIGHRFLDADQHALTALEEQGGGGESDGAEELLLFPGDGAVGGQASNEHVLLALDGVALIVHHTNPLDNLSLQTIAELFSCEQTDWAALGGPEGRVRLYAPAPTFGAHESFRVLVLERFGVELCSEVDYVQSEAILAKTIADTPHGLGFISLGSMNLARAFKSKPPAVSDCNLTHHPTHFNAKAEEYPLTQGAFLSAPPLEDLSAVLHRVVDYALSDRTQKSFEQKHDWTWRRTDRRGDPRLPSGPTSLS